MASYEKLSPTPVAAFALLALASLGSASVSRPAQAGQFSQPAEPSGSSGGVAVAVVTVLEGSANRSADGQSWAALAVGSALLKGDRVKTLAQSRMEVKLGDGSMFRLGATTELHITEAAFGSGHRASKKVNAKLVLGRLWAAVAELWGSSSSFEVSTPNAVAGVRGTRFATDQDADGNTTVKVYGGQVVVSNRPIYAVKGATKENRVQVAGPQEITKQQWEELIAGALQMVRVSATGVMSKPEGFRPKDGLGDDWEAWNNTRDQKAGFKDKGKDKDKETERERERESDKVKSK